MERDNFRFTGWDIDKYEDIIKVSMRDYANIMDGVKQMRKANRHESLTRMELKEYRKFTGKLS